MSSIQVTKRDVIWSYLGMFMTLGSNLFLLPIILNKLSESELGLWYTFLAVGNIAVLFDFGFKPTMARNITYAWCGAKELKEFGATIIETNNNEINIELLKRVMEVSKRIYFIISLLAGFFLLSVGSMYIFNVASELNVKTTLFSWIIYVVAVFMNLYYGYLNAFLNGIGAIKEMHKANVLARFIQLIVAFSLLLAGMGIVSVSIAYLVYGLVFRQSGFYYLAHYHQLKEKLQNNIIQISNDEIKIMFKTIWHNAWRDGVVAFSNYLNGQAITLLCSWFLSLAETATYGLTSQLGNAIASLSCVFYSAFQTKMQATFIANKKEETKKILSISLVIYYVCYILGAVILCTLGIQFITIIKSNTEINMLLLCVFLVYMFFYKNQVLAASYIAGTNRIIYMKSYVISGITTILLTIVLLKFTEMRMWAIVIAPFIVETLYNNWKWPRVVKKELGLTTIGIIKIGYVEIKKQIISFWRRL